MSKKNCVKNSDNGFDNTYTYMMMLSAIVQAGSIFLSGSIMATLVPMRFVVTAMFAFWVSVVVIIYRNPQTPKTVDLVYIAVGFLPVLVLTRFVSLAVWRIR